MINHKNQPIDWSPDTVVMWLNSNGFAHLSKIFIDYNIHHDRFLNLNMNNVNDLLKNTNISTLEKQRLVFSIQKLKAEDQANKTQTRPRIAIPSYSSNNTTTNNRTSETSFMSSSPSPTRTLRKNSCNFDITQYIPKRTSSNETNVHKMLEAFQPTLKASSPTSATTLTTSPRINANDPEILSKLFGKRLPLPTSISQDRRIQVTLDADTFIRLWIKHSSTAADIKHAVLYKLVIEADPSYFLFYHENGIQSTVPLNDDELVYICQTSDDNRTNRVLVVPIEGYNLVRQQRTHYQTRPNYYNGTVSSSTSLSTTYETYSVYYTLTSNFHSSPTPSPISSLENSITGIQLCDPETPREELPLIDLNPAKTTLSSNDLWATMPSAGNEARRPSTATTSELWAVPPSNASSDARRPSATPSLWHIRPSTSTSTSTTLNNTSSSSSSHLWPVGDQRSELSAGITVEGISLHDPPTPINDHSDVDFPASVDTPPSPIGSDKTQRSSSESTVEDTEMFGERPSVEKLYRDIDKYLPGHDLDKEILVEAAAANNVDLNAPSAPPTPSPSAVTPTATTTTKDTTTANAIPPAVSRRLLGHRQSVRVVAKQAHQRWKQATNNIITVNTLLRRKSTKMWDRPVERVKPGEESRIIATDTLMPTKMQWMRGNLIGRGSFGRVYHALNIATGDWLAVKQVDAAVTQSDRRNQDLQAAADALYREIRLLKDLDHENIVQYIGYDSNVEEGHIYIFLEYVPGGSISSLLSQYHLFDEALVKFFTRQILCGLQYLHTRHILHRDIKAGNVLIDHNGVCKITDFGLSKNQQEGAYDPMANNSTMRGTVFWMAPEVLTNNYSAKVDVWSLGCTVLEMMTGEHPWMELTSLAALYQIGNHKAPAIPESASDEARDFLQSCFQIKPEDRPTASELLQHPFVQPDPTFDFKESLKQQARKTQPS